MRPIHLKKRAAPPTRTNQKPTLKRKTKVMTPRAKFRKVNRRKMKLVRVKARRRKHLNVKASPRSLGEKMLASSPFKLRIESFRPKIKKSKLRKEESL